MPEFTTDHIIHDDGRFEFRCVQDEVARPWLTLHPHNSLYLQALNFWAPFEVGVARGRFATDKWTALTETSWELGDRNVGKAIRGIAEPVNEHDSLAYAITMYDADDQLVYRLSGKGVIFQNRDFGAWREQAKKKVGALPKPNKFEYAAYTQTGAADQAQSFMSNLLDTKTPTAQALVTMGNGFIPNHPYLSGSGDHVNATHLHVIGEQFTCLLEGDRKFTSTSGRMTFNNYVEIGHPIDVKLNEKSGQYIDISFYQADILCAGMSLTYRFYPL